MGAIVTKKDQTKIDVWGTRRLQHPRMLLIADEAEEKSEL